NRPNQHRSRRRPQSENNPPVGSNGDAPKAGEIALQRMQSEPRKVHVLGPGRTVQKRQNTGDLINLPSIQAAPIVVGVKGVAGRDGESAGSFAAQCEVTIITCQYLSADGHWKRRGAAAAADCTP